MGKSGRCGRGDPLSPGTGGRDGDGVRLFMRGLVCLVLVEDGEETLRWECSKSL